MKNPFKIGSFWNGELNLLEKTLTNNMLKFTHINIIFFSFYLFLVGCVKETEHSKDPAAPSETSDPKELTESARKKQAIGAYTEAVEELKKALVIDPNFIPAHYRMGLVYEEWDNRPEALNSYKKVLELKPDYTDARMGLASVYAKQVKNELAIGEYKKVAQLKPRDREIPFKIALEYWYLQKLPETAAYYEKAIALDPNYLQAHLNLASVYERMKDWDNALKEIAISMHLAKINQDDHTVSIAKNKLVLFKGRMNMTSEDFKRKTQPPFE